MKVKCIIIEDEPLALSKLAGFIGQVGYLNLLQGFGNAVDALLFLKENSVDLIFLDIRMKKLTGIQFLESLKNKPKVIITTAYDQYALKGYELEVSDYLLKPFSFERFLKSVDKVYNELLNMGSENFADFLFVKNGYRIEKVLMSEILFIRGMKDYLQIVMPGRKIMTLQSFKNMVQVLPVKDFVRVHNSYIVALSKIESIEHNRIKIGGELIPVSESYREEFHRVLKENYYLD
jgi:DNA-binding LytR/AlgR family response regulator